MTGKPPFRFLRKWVEVERLCDGSERLVTHCEYEAGFWEGPTEPGEVGRYVKFKCRDTVTPHGLLNTAPSVSYYSALVKALGK